MSFILQLCNARLVQNACQILSDYLNLFYILLLTQCITKESFCKWWSVISPRRFEISQKFSTFPKRYKFGTKYLRKLLSKQTPLADNTTHVNKMSFYSVNYFFHLHFFIVKTAYRWLTMSSKLLKMGFYSVIFFI